MKLKEWNQLVEIISPDYQSTYIVELDYHYMVKITNWTCNEMRVNLYLKEDFSLNDEGDFNIGYTKYIDLGGYITKSTNLDKDNILNFLKVEEQLANFDYNRLAKYSSLYKKHQTTTNNNI